MFGIKTNCIFLYSKTIQHGQKHSQLQVNHHAIISFELLKYNINKFSNMKAKSTLTILAILFTIYAYPQYSTIELTFTAKSNGQHVLMDSILIENLTQGGDTTLYFPDTVLVFDFISSINDNESNEKNRLCISQNYPNPFAGTTEVDLFLPDKQRVKIFLSDILGRELVQYENTLDRGNHTFELNLRGEHVVFLTACGKNNAESINMLSTNNNSTCDKAYHIEHKYTTGETDVYKSNDERNGFVFKLSDYLRYTAYGMYGGEVYISNVITDPPYFTENYEFDFIARMPCPGIPTITYEGQVYRTVLIGDQCWMGENLNIGTMITGIMTDNGIIEKNCFDNDFANCTRYGGLYRWDEMMQYTATSGTQGICPPGWHIPSDEDWKILEGTADTESPVGDYEWNLSGYRGKDAGRRLKAKDNWYFSDNGDDYFGFTGLPVDINSIKKEINYKKAAAWWVSSELSYLEAWNRTLHYTEDGMGRFNSYKTRELHVRCIKDGMISY